MNKKTANLLRYKLHKASPRIRRRKRFHKPALAQAIRALRYDLQLTQREMARRLGLGVGEYVGIETHALVSQKIAAKVQKFIEKLTQERILA